MPASLIFLAVWHCFWIMFWVLFDLALQAFLAAHSRTALAAENLFLRKQLALFQERKAKPHRAEIELRASCKAMAISLAEYALALEKAGDREP